MTWIASAIAWHVDARWLELIALYGVVPVAFAVAARRYDYRGAMAPLLWCVSLVLGLIVWRDPAFDGRALYAVPFEHPYVRTVCWRFGILGTLLLVFGRWVSPGTFLWLPRKRTGLWLVFLVAYPTLSAVPQGLIWRVFFVYRYGTLFEDQAALALAGALAFSLAHLAFWNRTALAVTAVGGWLFLETYLDTGSMLLAAAEHGAYGAVAFTAGLGTFLYRGRGPRTARSASQSQLERA